MHSDKADRGRNWSIYLVTAGWLFVLPGMANAATDLPRRDNQIWFEGWLTIPAGKSTEITVIGSARLGRGLDHWVFERSYISVSQHFLKLFTLGSYYSYNAVQGLPQSDVREHRLGIDATVSWRLGDFQLSDRSRIETRYLPEYTYTRYRNRLQVQHPVLIRDRRVMMFASEEIYYDGHVSDWSRSRFTAGVNKRVSSRMSMEFYYLRQNDHYSRPGDLNAFGITVKGRTRASEK